MTCNKIAPADRVDEIKEYYFSRKLREVAAMKTAGADVISLAIGGPDLPPSPEVIDVLAAEAARRDTHSYQPTTGAPALRQAWADWYRRWYDVALDPATELQPLIGSKEGVLLLSLTFLNPGDGVLVPNPGYPTYTSASKLAQAEIFSYDLTAERGWQPDFDQLEGMPLDRIRMMWVNYPHMPTGTPADMDVLRRIIDFGRRHNIVIAHDNPYSFILCERPTSIMQIDGARDVAVEMNSLSKSHNMAGWRMAVAVSNPTFIVWMLKVKSNMESGQFLPMMHAATEALQASDQWYRDLNATYRERRAVAERIMNALGCRFDPKQTGLFLWGRIPDAEAGAEALADRLLYDKHVFLTPGSIFGSNGERYIRISLCAPVATLERALERLTQKQS